MDLINEKKRYVNTDKDCKDTESNKICVLLDGVEGDAEKDIDELLSKSLSKNESTESVLKRCS